jgi:hypothetical protein
MLTSQDEERIRRAIRHAVRSTRGHDLDFHIEYVLDLVPYLSEAARMIAREEATLTLSELIGAD